MAEIVVSLRLYLFYIKIINFVFRYLIVLNPFHLPHNTPTSKLSKHQQIINVK